MLEWLFFLLVLVVLIIVIIILYYPTSYSDSDQNNIRNVTNQNSKYSTFINFATTDINVYHIPISAAYRDSKLRAGQTAQGIRNGIRERCEENMVNVDFYTIDFRAQEFILDPGNPNNIVGDVASETPFNFTHNITTDTTWVRKDYGIPGTQTYTSSTGLTTVTISVKTKKIKSHIKSYIEVVVLPSGPQVYLVGTFTAINSSIFPKLQGESGFRIFAVPADLEALSDPPAETDPLLL